MYNYVQVMKDQQNLVKIKDAAKMLSVNPQTLRRWDAEGRLVAVRIGKRKDRRYKPEDIQKIMNDNKKM